MYKQIYHIVKVLDKLIDREKKRRLPPSCGSTTGKGHIRASESVHVWMPNVAIKRSLNMPYCLT